MGAWGGVQRAMRVVIMTWAAANADVGYKQGMHELAAAGALLSRGGGGAQDGHSVGSLMTPMATPPPGPGSRGEGGPARQHA